MTKNQALKIAIESIKAQQKKIVFEANSARMGYNSDDGYFVRCLKKDNEFNEAIKILEGSMEVKSIKNRYDLENVR